MMMTVVSDHVITLGERARFSCQCHIRERLVLTLSLLPQPSAPCKSVMLGFEHEIIHMRSEVCVGASEGRA